MSQTDIEAREYLATAQKPSAALIISNKDLAPLMARATGAALRGSTIPILECALFGVSDGVLTVETTNMELVMRQTLAVPCSASWKAAINTELLSGVCRRLGSDAELTFEHTDRTVVLRSGRTRVSFQTLAIDDFPNFQDQGYTVEFEMQARDLDGLLARTAPFISDDQSRYYLSGVHFMAQQHEGALVLRAAATNGTQGAVVRLALPPGAGDIPEIIVPRQAVGEIVKLLDGRSDAISLAVSHNRVRLVVGHTTFITKLVDGTFPDIDRVIPQGGQNILRVDKRSFIRALDLVTIMAERKGLRVVKLDLEATSATLTTHDPESGQAVEVIARGDMEYEGEPMTITFQPKYLADVARLCGETVEFRFSDPAAPFRARDVADDSAVYIAMGAR